MSDTYETDVLAWSTRQADLLRRRAAGTLANEADIDWTNLAEEIEDVGKSELRSVASHLVQAILHDLKVAAWPQSREVPHWQAEARMQRDEARAAYTPSMAVRRELNVDTLQRRALRGLPATIDGVPPLPLEPPEFTLAELLAAPSEY